MTDTTAGGPRPTTTNAEIRVLNCNQCADCVNGPTPELREETSPDGETKVRVPTCFRGTVYPRSGYAVCTLFKEWHP